MSIATSIPPLQSSFFPFGEIAQNRLSVLYIEIDDLQFRLNSLRKEAKHIRALCNHYQKENEKNEGN